MCMHVIRFNKILAKYEVNLESFQKFSNIIASSTFHILKGPYACLCLILYQISQRSYVYLNNGIKLRSLYNKIKSPTSIAEYYRSISFRLLYIIHVHITSIYHYLILHFKRCLDSNLDIF